MATAQNLEERFQAAVKKIQTLPSNGPIQPSNITKLTFYGLYKHVTVGPCTDPKPYAFNIVARAKCYSVSCRCIATRPTAIQVPQFLGTESMN